jgi:hypothetical protein
MCVKKGGEDGMCVRERERKERERKEKKREGERSCGPQEKGEE